MTGNLIKIPTELLVRTSSHMCRFIYPVFSIPFRPVYRALITKGTSDVLLKDSCNETPNVFICRDRCHVRLTRHTHTHTFNSSSVLFLLLNRNVWAK